MGPDERKHLLDAIFDQQLRGGEVAVPLDLFFRGNDDPGSIGCNLGDAHPSIAAFYRVLSALRDRADVQDIWIRICDAGDEMSWPYSDTAYVIAALPQGEIEAALAPLRFDEIHAGWMYGKPPAAPDPQAGFLAYSVWWD